MKAVFCILSDHNEIKLEINSQKSYRKHKPMEIEQHITE